jgi:hypothetical protein
MLAIVVLAASLFGIGAWAGRRHRAAAIAARGRDNPRQRAAMAPLAPRSGSGPAPGPAAAPASPVPIDIARLEAASTLAAGRLWKLAFAAPSQAQVSADIHRRVRDNVIAVLEVDALAANYFPRRPALMSQLLQAVDDPRAAAERISRIIAHDPVLTADVLRLANSSLYRRSATAVETIPRAIVACGAESLRAMLATAMLRPVFRATRRNFPRLPRMLWERTERASRAAELYSREANAGDRFEAQLAVLQAALGPLVVYSAAIDVYARNPHFAPSAELCVELIGSLAPRMALRVARDWQCSPRLLAALEGSAQEPLTAALRMGEFLGTLALLEAHAVISSRDRRDLIAESGAGGGAVERTWAALSGAP